MSTLIRNWNGIHLCQISAQKAAFLIFLLVAWAYEAKSQFNETIRTGRPGQAIGAFTVGKGIFQVQSGFDYFRSANNDIGFKSEGFLNNTVVRFGLTDPFEVSALFEYKTESVRYGGEDESQQGLSAMDVGMRYHIFTGDGLIPNVGFQIRFRLPMLSEPYEIKDVAPRFIFATSQTLGKHFTLITNLGASWNGNNSAPTGIYIINLSFPFSKSLGSYIETYGSVHRGVFTIKFDSGIAWLLNENLQLDLHGGVSENHGVSEQFLSVGVSARTNRK